MKSIMFCPFLRRGYWGADSDSKICAFSTAHCLCKTLEGETALSQEPCPYLRNDKIKVQEIQMHLQNEIAILGHYQFILFAK